MDISRLGVVTFAKVTVTFAKVTLTFVKVTFCIGVGGLILVVGTHLRKSS